MKKRNILLIMAMLFLSSNAFADDMTKSFNNVSDFWNSLFDLAYGVSLILGIIFGGKALFEAIEVSKSQSSGNEKSYKMVIVYFFASALLMSSLSYIQTMTETLSLSSINADTAGDIFATNTGIDDSNIKAAVDCIFMFFRFYGFFVTIQAITEFARLQSGRPSDHTTGGLVTKFFAGILLMHMLSVLSIVNDTLDLGWSIF